MAGEKKLSDLRLGASLSRLGIGRGRTSSGSRLNSLKPARDLTLGSTPKRTFIPNLPARRIVKEDPATEKQEAGPSKARSEKRARGEQNRSRGRGRGRGEIVTSQSIFSQGPFADPRSVGAAISASSQSSKRESGSRDARSRVSVISEGKGELENDEESQRVLDMLGDSGKIEINADELQHGGLVPITVPLADPKQFGQKVKGAAQEIPPSRLKVKLETCDDDDDDDDDDVDMVDVTNVGNVSSPPRIDSRTKRHLDCKGLFSSSSAEERLLFMQFPDVLPIKPLSHEQNVSADNEDISDSSSVAKSEEERPKFSFNNVSEGCIGKLVVHKSGKVRMVLGNTSLHVEMGTPCGFLQDLMAVHLEEGRREMVCLGHINHRIICVPDYEELIGSAGS